MFDGDFLGSLAQEVDVLAVAVKAAPGHDGTLVDAVPALLSAAAVHGTRLGVVGGAGSLLVAEGGSRLVDAPAFPAPARAEAAAAAAVLDALLSSGMVADWFVLSSAAGFGGFAPGERTGRFRLGGDVLLTAEDGRSFISGADYAIAFVDELEEPVHHRERFSVAY